MTYTKGFVSLLKPVPEFFCQDCLDKRATHVHYGTRFIPADVEEARFCYTCNAHRIDDVQFAQMFGRAIEVRSIGVMKSGEALSRDLNTTWPLIVPFSTASFR